MDRGEQQAVAASVMPDIMQSVHSAELDPVRQSGADVHVPHERRRADDSGAVQKKQQAARIARLSLTGMFAALYLAVLGIFYLQHQIELRVIQFAGDRKSVV